MDKNVSRRNETLKKVEEQMMFVEQTRAEFSKELAEVENHRADLMATLDILSHQAQGLQQVLDRANSPQVETAVDFDLVRGAAMNATEGKRWQR